LLGYGSGLTGLLGYGSGLQLEWASGPGVFHGLGLGLTVRVAESGHEFLGGRRLRWIGHARHGVDGGWKIWVRACWVFSSVGSLAHGSTGSSTIWPEIGLALLVAGAGVPLVQGPPGRHVNGRLAGVSRVSLGFISLFLHSLYLISH
jgi:hypothetical protein